jgi:hypothetical protein
MEKVINLPKGLEKHLEIGNICNLISKDSSDLGWNYLWYSAIYVRLTQLF